MACRLETSAAAASSSVLAVDAATELGRLAGAPYAGAARVVASTRGGGERAVQRRHTRSLSRRRTDDVREGAPVSVALERTPSVSAEERRQALARLRRTEELYAVIDSTELELRSRRRARSESDMQRLSERRRELEALSRREREVRRVEEEFAEEKKKRLSVVQEEAASEVTRTPSGSSCPVSDEASLSSSLGGSSTGSRSIATRATRSTRSSASKFASDEERELCLKSFLEKHRFAGGVNAPKKNLFRMTYPLHTAAKTADARIVAALLESGADAALRDSRGNTALAIARAKNVNDSHTAVVCILTRHANAVAAQCEV
mmetsp:Transcript_23431/g.67141  ORF Transcript_23431/g.67141 Transcript_23431/m.67141 type:complete len:319 (+) Transcript_23431:112-1068(+)|eukprot:CAMPEP_0176090366 /NCGR_PEP_ID=MMETSP0120_2-20121206/45257_1 /TAXON_ID=160619 /ORGANISM="Kryptoperidinium foliaceum, Strain CCMP 1326" /LENGTH=318 /DNA_ID=CAMNT_0017424247 /DNA_START=35 /DNA_END=991 /DNA_ORIENTATION=+